MNQIRLLGEELSDKRIMEKALVSLPKRFEAKISYCFRDIWRNFPHFMPLGSTPIYICMYVSCTSLNRQRRQNLDLNRRKSRERMVGLDRIIIDLNIPSL